MSKTKKTLSKRKKSGSGKAKGKAAGTRSTIYGSIMVAKGLLATLETFDRLAFTRKLARTEPEHLRILLREVMEEIYTAEMNLVSMKF